MGTVIAAASANAAAVVMVMMEASSPCDEVTKVLLRSFEISDETLRGLLGKFERELESGLSPDTREDSDIKGLPTYVTSTPDGTEEGSFIALDLGGTNFRIMLVKIMTSPEASLQMDSQIFFVPGHIMTGTGEQLFDFIADDLFEFLNTRGLVEELGNLPIGFTFSFPTKNLGIKKTVLVYWSKGYTCSGVVGEDLGQLLNNAIRRRFSGHVKDIDMKLQLPTVVNDTVGTMIASGYNNNDVSMGLIVGTGTNICYMESQTRVKIISDQEDLPGDEMCINCEWGTFGDHSGALSEIFTEFDRDIDENSVNPGVHLFEKFIGGMYLGELARRVIMKLHDDKKMFVGRIGDKSELRTPGLSTAFVSQLSKPDLKTYQIQAYLEGLGLSAEPEECEFVVQICNALSSRAAKLCAVGVVAAGRRVADHRGVDTVTIGVDGSVYKKHPTFSRMLSEAVRLLDPTVAYKFVLSNDGSGKGAALVAAVDTRINRPHIKEQIT